MSSLDEISRAIGALEAQNAMILRSQERHNAETDAIRTDLQTLSTDMQVVKKGVKDFEPVAKKVRQWEQRAVGMSLLGGLVGSWVLAQFRGWFG